MKQGKTADLRQKPDSELSEVLSKLRSDYKDVSADFLQKKEKNVKKPGQLKREIARILTLMNERKFINEKKNI